jgi:acyl dehydratase
VCVSREEIVAFARMSHDANPLHTDKLVAQRARFGEIIASGQHTAAMLMGMLATHFSRSDDGVRREMLCLNMNFAFKGPVFADQDVTLRWKVASVQWNGKLQGVLAHLDGRAGVTEGKPAVVARGTILLKELPA